MKQAVAAVALVLICLSLANNPQSNSVPNDAPSQPLLGRGPAWWNLNWRFRIPLTVKSSTNISVNRTILAWVDIPYGRTVNAFRDLRLVDSSLEEVPSAVLYERKQSIFTTGAAVSFSTLLLPGPSYQDQVYYGNPAANPPPYRKLFPIQSYNTGLINLGFTQDVESIAYHGESYSTFYTTKFRYNNSIINDYGPQTIANQSLSPISPWQLDPGANSTFTVASAGNLVDLRLAKSTGKALTIIELLVNRGPTVTSNVLAADLFDASAMSSRGLVVGGFNQTDNLAFASVGTNFLGIKGEQPPSRFEVNSPTNVYGETRTLALTNSSSATGSVTIAVNWSLGDIPPGGHAILTRNLTFEASYANLTQSLSVLASTPSIVFSSEQSLPSPIPSAYTLFANQVQSQDLAIGPSGYTSSYTPSNSSWVVPTSSLVGNRATSFTGNASYGLPGPGDYDFESPNIWTASPSTSLPGRYVSYSSTHSWSEETTSYTAAVHLWDNDTSNFVQGNVSSRLINVVGAHRISLSFSYRLNNNLTGGQPSAYIALLADLNLDSIPDTVFYISGQGTSPSSNSSTILQNDGRWHYSQVDLTNLTNSQDFRFSIRIFASTNGIGSLGVGAKGIVELEVDNIHLQVSGRAQDIFYMPGPGLDPYTDKFSLAYARQGLNTSTLNPRANVTFSFVTVAPMALTVLPKGVFSANFPQANPATMTLVNDSAILLGVQGSYLKSVKLNGTPLSPSDYVIANSALVTLGSGFQDVTSSARLLPFTLTVTSTYATLTIQPLDANGDAVVGSSFISLDGFGREVLGNVSAQGGLQISLVPFSYTIQGTYHGVVVYSSSIMLDKAATLEPRLPIFKTTFLVRDLFGMSISGAEVSVARNGTTIVEATTDGKGRISVELVADTSYTIKVMYQGQTLLQKVFTPALNNLSIDLSTGYASLSARIGITGTIVGSALLIVVLARRRFKT